MTQEQERALSDIYARYQRTHHDIFWKGYLDHDYRFGDQFAMFNFGNCDCYAVPDNETVLTFRDRIYRSIKAGRNLFFEEWEPLPPYKKHSAYGMGRMQQEDAETAVYAYWKARDAQPDVFSNAGLAIRDYCYGDFVLECEHLAYKAPDDETLDTFKDRIERSIKAGRNLFPEEWDPLPPFRKDVIY